MRILFHLAHPAQYHMFKYVIRTLGAKGHVLKITINSKDILEKLLRENGMPYENILPKRRKSNNNMAALWTLIKKDLKIFRLLYRNKYDLLVGTETALAHAGWLFRKPTLIFNEDDVSGIAAAAKLSFPFARHIVSPESCDLGKWSKKKISYDGYQKMAYLHPDYFKPKRSIVENILKNGERLFMIRMSALDAYHDQGAVGLSEDLVEKIIVLLSPYGRVLISAERKLSDRMNRHVLKAKASDIHHFLYYADMLIADSQSMCVEAAILGTPSIRFNSFAGRVGVLNELEDAYGLTFGIGPTRQDLLFKKIAMMVNRKDIKREWASKTAGMLNDKIDVAAFWTWLIDGYPDSVQTLKKNPDYQKFFQISSAKKNIGTRS